MCFPLKNRQLVIEGSDTACTITVNTKLLVDLMCLYNMGLRRFVVTDMGPMGCLPTITIERSYEICNATSNNYIFLYYIYFLFDFIQTCRKWAYRSYSFNISFFCVKTISRGSSL